tara:strand:- start:164 stop:454 length:291 start_codon:yes stop_codon:yes gene_type:complete
VLDELEIGQGRSRGRTAWLVLRRWEAGGAQSLPATGAEHGAAERVYAAADRTPAGRRGVIGPLARRSPRFLLKVKGKSDLLVSVRERGRSAALVDA